MSGSAGRPSPPPRRIVIAGGGLSGLALALALKRGLGEAVAVELADPALARDPVEDSRAYAIAAGPRRMLETLGVFEAIAPLAQPIRAMVITDSALGDPVRQSFLTFEEADAEGEPLAHMVESRTLARVLRDAAGRAGATLTPRPVTGFTATPRAIEVESGGEKSAAALLVAADGARSRLREAAGIGWVGRSYPQVGIASTIRHERPHEGRAIQHFLPSGPFAMLPLPDAAEPGGAPAHRSSIVWTERAEIAPALLAGDAESRVAEIERRFGLELGALSLETPLQSFPLAVGLARDFVGTRVALLGDAAHVIHPLAGQGLNLGLTDAAALAETIADAVRLGLDPGGAEALRGYERARRAETVAMAAATDGLNRLFSNDVLPVRLARDLGLGLVDRAPTLKRLFARRASGGAAWRLLQGEEL